MIRRFMFNFSYIIKRFFGFESMYYKGIFFLLLYGN